MMDWRIERCGHGEAAANWGRDFLASEATPGVNLVRLEVIKVGFK